MKPYLALVLAGAIVWPAPSPSVAEEATAPQRAALGDCRQEAPAEVRLSACTTVIERGNVETAAMAYAYLQRGLARAESGDLESAIKDFDSAIKLAPKATDALYDRGAANAQLHRWKAALADFDRLLKIAPKDADALYMRAWVHAQMGSDERAIADLDAVVALYPNDQAAYFDRAGLLLRAGRPRDAIKDYTRVLEMDPQAAAAAFNRGRAHYLLARYREAAKDFKLALSILPQNPYAALRLHLAELHGGQGAAQPLKAAAQALGADEWPRQLLSVYLGALKPQDVLDALSEVPDSDRPRLLCEANYYLGALAEAGGDAKSARAHFEAALRTEEKSSVEFIDAGLALKAR